MVKHRINTKSNKNKNKNIFGECCNVFFTNQMLLLMRQSNEDKPFKDINTQYTTTVIGLMLLNALILITLSDAAELHNA